MTGRRRIGKTTLIQKAIQPAGERPVCYVQVPDSGPAGVLSAVDDAMGTFAVPRDRFLRPHDFRELARMIGALARGGYAVVLDEFQHFNRARLQPFCSFLQAEVDALASDAARVPGGLLVLGSIHMEMAALLENRSAAELVGDLPVFDGHVGRFLDQFPRYKSWRVEQVSLALRVPDDVRRALVDRGRLVQDLTDLIAEL